MLLRAVCQLVVTWVVRVDVVAHDSAAFGEHARHQHGPRTHHHRARGHARGRARCLIRRTDGGGPAAEARARDLPDLVGGLRKHPRPTREGDELRVLLGEGGGAVSIIEGAVASNPCTQCMTTRGCLGRGFRESPCVNTPTRKLKVSVGTIAAPLPRSKRVATALVAFPPSPSSSESKSANFLYDSVHLCDMLAPRAVLTRSPHQIMK